MLLRKADSAYSDWLVVGTRLNNDAFTFSTVTSAPLAAMPMINGWYWGPSLPSINRDPIDDRHLSPLLLRCIDFTLPLFYRYIRPLTGSHSVLYLWDPSMQWPHDRCSIPRTIYWTISIPQVENLYHWNGYRHSVPSLMHSHLIASTSLSSLSSVKVMSLGMLRVTTWHLKIHQK